jgi:hypothetical protein
MIGSLVDVLREVDVLVEKIGLLRKSDLRRK